NWHDALAVSVTREELRPGRVSGPQYRVRPRDLLRLWLAFPTARARMLCARPTPGRRCGAVGHVTRACSNATRYLDALRHPRRRLCRVQRQWERLDCGIRA